MIFGALLSNNVEVGTLLDKVEKFKFDSYNPCT